MDYKFKPVQTPQRLRTGFNILQTQNDPVVNVYRPDSNGNLQLAEIVSVKPREVLARRG